MFVKNLNAEQQSALLALATHICSQIPQELQIYQQGYSVVDAVFGANREAKLTKLDILKRQMGKEVQPSVVDITKLNEVFNTHRAKLSVIGALIWLNGHNKDTINVKEHEYSVLGTKYYVLHVDSARTIYFYSQLLQLNWEKDVAPFYNWYDLQYQADCAADLIFPVPEAFEKVEIKG